MYRTLIRTALLIGFLCACQASPDFTLADGSSGRFSDYRGKWLYINYWAEWCKPCLEEIPELNRFAAQNMKNVQVLAVNYDNLALPALQTQIAKLNIDVAALTADPSQRLGYPRPQVLPATVIFDPKGQLHTTLVGPQTTTTLTEAMH